jgi:hypothetical protein
MSEVDFIMETMQFMVPLSTKINAMAACQGYCIDYTVVAEMLYPTIVLQC